MSIASGNTFKNNTSSKRGIFKLFVSSNQAKGGFFEAMQSGSDTGETASQPDPNCKALIQYWSLLN